MIMSNRRNFVLVSAFIALAPTSATKAARLYAEQAKPGETVVVNITTVKADKRQQFEDALSKFLAVLPKAAEVDKTTRQVMEPTRILAPVKPNDDGTFTYVSLADPALPDASAYDTNVILKKVMPEAEAEKLTKQFEDATAGQQILILRQRPNK